jgi:hypothetical protein
MIVVISRMDVEPVILQLLERFEGWMAESNKFYCVDGLQVSATSSVNENNFFSTCQTVASIADTPAVSEVVTSRRRPLPLMGNIRDLLELLMASNTTRGTISVV